MQQKQRRSRPDNASSNSKDLEKQQAVLNAVTLIQKVWRNHQTKKMLTKYLVNEENEG